MSNLINLKSKIIQNVADKEELTEEIVAEFKTLEKDHAIELIDLIISDIDAVPAINRLLRIKESLTVVFDPKLLLVSVRNTLIQFADL